MNPIWAWSGGLGGHDQVALVLTVLVVDHDHHLAAADGGHDLVDWRKAHVPASRSLSTYLAMMSTSRLTWSPAERKPRCGHLERVRDQRDLEPAGADRGHGETDSIDGDRALLDHDTGPGPEGTSMAQTAVIAIGDHLADHMPTPSTWPWTM